MKIKTPELTGPALDWAVAKCEGYDPLPGTNGNHLYNEKDMPDYRYSTNWAEGGPIIEREKIDLYYSTAKSLWAAAIWKDVQGGGQLEHKHTDCPTPLLAAMRCYVASKWGDEAEVPDELA